MFMLIQLLLTFHGVWDCQETHELGRLWRLISPLSLADKLTRVCVSAVVWCDGYDILLRMPCHS